MSARQHVFEIIIYASIILAAIAVLVLLSCCVHSPAHDSDDGRALASAQQAWGAAGFLIPEHCLDRCEIKRHGDYAEFKAACRHYLSTVDDPRILTGCVQESMPAIPWQPNYYTIHIAPNNTHEHTTIEHEALHVLLLCTSLAEDNNGDALHTNPRIWIAAGGDPETGMSAADSVEARANQR